MGAHHEPGEPGHGQHGHRQHVNDEPAVIVNFFFLHEMVDALSQHAFPAVIQHRQMEGVASRRQIGVHDGAKGALSLHRPIAVKALHIIAHQRILNGVIDDFGVHFYLAHAPVHLDWAASFKGGGFAVQPHGGKHQAVGPGAGFVPAGIDNEHARIAGQKQNAAAIVIVPGVGGEGAVQALPGIQ